jgi:hypothetical protein
MDIKIACCKKKKIYCYWTSLLKKIVSTNKCLICDKQQIVLLGRGVWVLGASNHNVYH